MNGQQKQPLQYRVTGIDRTHRPHILATVTNYNEAITKASKADKAIYLEIRITKISD
ncbi:hypothetical protein EDC44_10918 [Cricetibacter osteomyelitidis]|uniref:Uncharacterized protein n=1 Tax=Cricetibacter osteomyelitidis TaxID=1521931 RepID=A0A4R2SXV2_9PAST|nr:hypothetical protein [Cricetibacter osteomyelitidis]TCP95327.1 hypothetical protein EDC44_10918 [Cricetibacter osteomyelitidis]